MKEYLKKYFTLKSISSIIPYVLIFVLMWQMASLPTNVQNAVYQAMGGNDTVRITKVKTVEPVIQSMGELSYFQGLSLDSSFKIADEFSFGSCFVSETYDGYFTPIMTYDSTYFYLWSKNFIPYIDNIKPVIRLYGLVSNQRFQYKKTYIHVFYPITEKVTK